MRVFLGLHVVACSGCQICLTAYAGVASYTSLCTASMQQLEPVQLLFQSLLCHVINPTLPGSSPGQGSHHSPDSAAPSPATSQPYRPVAAPSMIRLPMFISTHMLRVQWLACPCRFRHQQRLPPWHMQSLLQQEYHICKADMYYIGSILHDGSLFLLRTGQRLSQVTYICCICC